MRGFRVIEGHRLYRSQTDGFQSFNISGYIPDFSYAFLGGEA